MKVITIRDVALEAGVSITTVSRVLNEREDVDPGTRQSVLAVIDRLHYMRNTSAANLKQRRSDFAAVILRGRRNIFLTDLAERVMYYGRESGFQCLMEFIDERADEFLAARGLYLERKLSGIIFLGSNLKNREKDIAGLDLPCVFATVDASHLALPHVSSASVDNFRSGREAADQLYRLGHRQIAMVGYFADAADSTGLRLAGVVEGLQAHGVPFDEGLFVDSDFTLQTAYRATEELLSRKKPFTALIAMSDTVAIGAGKALFDHGIRVPKDVSLVGFDGIEQGRYCTPSLATMQQPSEEIARHTVRLLTDMLRGAGGQHVLLRTSWIEGGSVRQIT
ncbi:MAG: LacI family DNA-binding transcriptional regulator [Christensenellales bacterium]